MHICYVQPGLLEYIYKYIVHAHIIQAMNPLTPLSSKNTYYVSPQEHAIIITH